MINLPWAPGGAQKDNVKLRDGEQMLVAIRTGNADHSKSWWEIAAITINGNKLIPHSSQYPDWTWNDVSWFLPIQPKPIKSATIL